MLYRYLKDSSVMVDFTIYSITVDNKYFDGIAAMYFCLAGVHGLLILHLIVRSARARKLCRPPQWIVEAWECARALCAVFDVRHKNYGLVFLVREIVMTFLQSVQTYRLSCLVSRLWMNHVMASLLVLNCWASPLLHCMFHSRVGHIRLGGGIVNLLLDVASYIVLPTALLLPYVDDFDRILMNFGRGNWFTDAWLINLINEVQLVFITSLYDATSKCVVALSVARGLYSTTKLIYAADAVVPVTVVPVKSMDLSSPRAQRLRARVESTGHLLLFLWGLIVFIAHAYATWLPAYPQCRLPVRPWFGTKPSCSLLEINCAVERTTGSVEDIDRILRKFDPNRIEYLVVRNCPLLQLPPRIQTLSQLFGLKLVSSTILEWNEDAGLTSTHHPTLRFLFVIDVKMRELPIGLRRPDFPQSLRDIEFSRTNITALPEDLDTIWPRGMWLSFEECQLQEVPPAVLRMRPTDLALGLNNITGVPRELLEEFPVRILLLDGNPLDTASFPQTLSRPPQVELLGFVRTNMTALPEWVDESVLATTYLVMGETPLCDRRIAAGEATTDEFRTLMGVKGVDCSLAFFASGTLNWFPIDDEAIVNPTYTLS
ncbi:hypothetical protein PybrP1_009917 [[Pythium] brassicae (nom. inval.)]|nr:hypothetical protein PybrP1_009917 [[Pythium] brassicae (nom. inval.)]